MCIAVVTEVEDSVNGDKFALAGTSKATLPKGVTKNQVGKEIHVVDENGKVHKNVGAILQILEEYPRWRFLSPIARLPLVYQLLQLVYKVIAANRHFIFGPASRIFWVKTVVILGLLAGMALSLPLWTGSSGTFPKAPVLSGVPMLPNYLNFGLFVALVATLVGALLYPRPRICIYAALGIGIILVFFDQMRLQPWFYQYFWMLAVIGVYSWRIQEKGNRHAVLQALRLIVAAIYFFSGLQKLNPAFMESVFPWMVLPITSLVPAPIGEIITSFGALVPLFEMAIGVGLLLPKLRKVSVVFAVMMAASILLLIGPLGHGWNSVVWPWNIVMPLCTWLLFWNKDAARPVDILLAKKFLTHKVIVVIFIFLPICSFYNRWDSYLSWTLYSGNTNNATIYLDYRAKSELPATVAQYAVPASNGKQVVSIFAWSMGELNVPPYPEARVFKKIAQQVCDYTQQDQSVELLIYGKPTQFRADNQKLYTCAEL